MIKSIGVFILMCCVSCSVKTDEVIDNDIQIEKVILNLSHGNLLLTRMGYEKAISGDSLLVYDNESYQFVIFNIDRNEPVWSLKLPADGPDFLEIPVLDMWFEKGKLYVLSRNYFSIYDGSTGMIVNRLGSDDIKGWNIDFHLTSFIYQSDVSILFAKQARAVRIPLGGVDDPKHSIVYKYSLATNKLDSLKISNPPETLAYDPEQGYYTNYSKPYLQERGDSLIFSFEFGSNIYLYTGTEKRVQTITAPSEYSSPFRAPENENIYRNNRAQYIYSGPKYFSILPLGDSNLFARSHGDYLENANGDNERVRFLTIFDDQFRVLKEIQLEDKVWDDPFVMGNKVMFIKLDRTLEDHFELITYEIR